MDSGLEFIQNGTEDSFDSRRGVVCLLVTQGTLDDFSQRGQYHMDSRIVSLHGFTLPENGLDWIPSIAAMSKQFPPYVLSFNSIF